MATPLPIIKRATQNDARDTKRVIGTVAILDPRTQDTKAPGQDWLLELANALQTTLELERLIQIFSGHVAGLVPHDSVEYRGEGGDLSICTADPAPHTCTYDVVLERKNLGKLTFTRARPFTPSETTVLENLLCNLVHPLQNALMYLEALAIATKCPLTGVNNRASLEHILAREVDLAVRHDTPLSVIMLDVDRFKTINDTYGHLVGDRALQKLVECMGRCLRKSDVVFRYGGEEFVILLTNTPLPGAVYLAERIRVVVEVLPIECQDVSLNITVSLGVAALAKDQRPVDLLNAADRALYRSKNAGRNRVSTAPTES